MKKRIFLFMIFMLIIMLMGCSGEAETAAEDSFYDITVEKKYFPDFKEIFSADAEPHSVTYLGTQFLGKEPVQLWGDFSSQDENKIYLCRINGERELVMTKKLSEENLSEGFGWALYSWYLDRDGYFYYINTESGQEFRKLDKEGNELYRVKGPESLPGQVNGLRHAPDGRMYIGLHSVEGRFSYLTLAEVDPDDGSITMLEVETDAKGVQGIYSVLGTGTSGPAVCGTIGIREVDHEKEELTDAMQFINTSYTWNAGQDGGVFNMMPVDFCINDDGSVGLLRADPLGRASYERLALEKVERIKVTICATELSDWIKRQMTRFNKENDTYYIMVEEFEIDPQMTEAEYTGALGDYARKISIQLATGGGPDILVGEEMLGDSIPDMMEKGAFEDLAPYMKRTGIQEEDYFPAAFGGLRRGEEIYGICPEIYLQIQQADGSILGSEPDIKELTETLSALQQEAVYIKEVSAGELLRLFLEGSETLWGMVDWEAGTCDFGGELFTNLLETAVRYGDDPRYAYRSLVRKQTYHTLYLTDTPSELEERGLTMVGWMFDDGCHAVIRGDQIVVNANSANKEGAWEFLSFLLENEAQKDVWFFPVNRNTFTGEWVNGALKQIEGYGRVYWNGFSAVSGEWEKIKTYTAEDRSFIEDEKIPSLIRRVEDARYLPLRTQPLLDIICEEAKGYFDGWKSAEEVVAIIENRVNLYLNEHK